MKITPVRDTFCLPRDTETEIEEALVPESLPAEDVTVFDQISEQVWDEINIDIDSINELVTATLHEHLAIAKIRP